MRTASRSSGFSPISAKRRVSSFTLSPASIRTRVFDVERNAAFPALPLASTQNLTITILLKYVLPLKPGQPRTNTDKHRFIGFICVHRWAINSLHLRFDDVDQFFHRSRALRECSLLVVLELDLVDL